MSNVETETLFSCGHYESRVLCSKYFKRNLFNLVYGLTVTLDPLL